MKKMFFVFPALIALVALILASLVWVASQTPNYTCPIILPPNTSLLEQIQLFNNTESPISQLHLTTADLNSLLFSKSNSKNCLEIQSGKLIFLGMIGTFSTQTTVTEATTTPYLNITGITFIDYPLPDFFINKYNANLKDAWEDFFDPNYSGRRITQIEILRDKIIVTGEYLADE